MKIQTLYCKARERVEFLYRQKQKFYFSSFKLTMDIYKFILRSEKDFTSADMIANNFKVTRRCVMKHIATLIEAGLILSKEGRGGGFYPCYDNFLQTKNSMNATSNNFSPNPPLNDLINNNISIAPEKTETKKILNTTFKTEEHEEKTNEIYPEQPQKKKKPYFYLMVCNADNGLDRLSLHYQKDFNELPDWYEQPCYDDITRGVVYDEAFKQWAKRKFKISESRFNQHIERFADFVCSKSKLEIKLYATTIGLFVKFMKHDRAYLEEKWQKYQDRKKKYENENYPDGVVDENPGAGRIKKIRRENEETIFSIADVLKNLIGECDENTGVDRVSEISDDKKPYSSFGGLKGKGRSYVTLTSKSLATQKN